MTLAESIARFEGYFVSGSVAQRNNNPGNLRSGPRQIGTDAKGYAIYATAEDGYADLDAQIDRNIDRGLTLREFFGGKPGVYAGYAPAADSNDPGHYADIVAGWTGTDPDAVLTRGGSGPVIDTTYSYEDSSYYPDLSNLADFSEVTPGQMGLALAAGVLLWTLLD